jgi:protein phosphatase
MDRIALISDIHGNMPALDATLSDIARRGIRRIFCLGDLVGKGPDSDLAVDRCREVCEQIIVGNWDDGFVHNPQDTPAENWHRQRLGEERIAFLGTLPATIDFCMSGKQVRLFHASQKGVYHRVHQNDPDEVHIAMFENTDFTGYTVTPDIVGYADIHDAFLKYPAYKTLFNVGSVGNPLDIPQASYVILEGTYGSQTPSPLSIQFMRVPYAIELAIQQASEANMPYLAPYAHELRTAEYVRRKKLAVWP